MSSAAPARGGIFSDAFDSHYVGDHTDDRIASRPNYFSSEEISERSGNDSRRRIGFFAIMMLMKKIGVEDDPVLLAKIKDRVEKSLFESRLVPEDKLMAAYTLGSQW